MNTGNHKLKFNLVWLTSDLDGAGALSVENNQLLKFKSFFTNEKFTVKNSESHIQFGCTKRCDLNTRCQETFCEVECTLSGYNINQNAEINTFFSKICREWCSLKSNKLFHWLKPISSSAYFQQTSQFHENIQVNSISFGTFINITGFVQHYFLQESQGQQNGKTQFCCSFWHDKNNLQLFAYIQHHSCYASSPEFFKLSIDYTSIMRVLIDDPAGISATSLYLHLKHPPKIFSNKCTFSREYLNITSVKKVSEYVDCWERAKDIGCSCRNTDVKGVVLGKCPVIKINIADKVRARRIIGRLYQRCHTDSLYYSPVTLEFSPFSHVKNPFHTFSCRYAWEVLMSKSFELIDQINSNFGKWEELCKSLCKFENMNFKALEKALLEFHEYLEKGLIISFFTAIKELFNFYSSSPEDTDHVSGLCFVRRAFITPLRILFRPPQHHLTNRVLRNFDPEFALRVSIRDDDLSQFTYCFSSKDNVFKQIISEHLNGGIYISPRHYKFLAASTSQLRNHGIWMYATDSKNNTAKSIRKWLGDFTGIHNVAKLMARMGQCFSSLEENVQIEIKKSEIVYEKDISCPRQRGLPPYIFSDGIGMISSDFVDKIYENITQNSNHGQKSLYRSCAFQIRLAGCKGMLVENPKLNNQVIVRDSMKKFECSSVHHLEVIKRSAPRSLFLNRPLITILEQLGVDQKVFLDLQAKMIFEFTDALLNDSKACMLLSTWIPHFIPFKKLYESGICFTQEPFFNSLLLSIYKTQMGLLKSKARIEIPPNYGRNMFGVLDETGTLSYGQVFVQYSEYIGNYESTLHILKGTVLVTKCPCMHPGDVRKFEAVDIPDLHHIKDCIVFPSRGPRPHPDEMAGSDLDGDEYVVIWMPELFFPGENIKPMHFPIKEKSRPRSSPILVKEMIEFLLSYIENDDVGRLGSAHLAWADQESGGIFSEKCLSIAKKYCCCLDFVKTGKKAYLHKSEKPDKYPDFMLKKHLNNSYLSEHVLGQLHRFLRSLDSTINQPVFDDSLIKLDTLLEYPGWENYKKIAEEDQMAYQRDLLAIQQAFDINNEGELYSGHIQTISKYDEMKGDRSNTVSVIQRNMKYLQEKFISRFYQNLREENQMDEQYKEHLYQKASAWYMVTYTTPDASLRSFPWIVASVLAEVRKSHFDKVPRTNVQSKCSLVEIIDICIKQKYNISFEDSTGSHKICKGQKLAFCTLWDWAFKNTLSGTVHSQKIIEHKSCFLKIFLQFVRSQNENVCSLTDCSCSPGMCVLKFLKYHTSYNSDSPVCSDELCLGSKSSLLNYLALRTYTILAVTRSPLHLAIMADDNCIMDNDFESDPFMIPIEDEELKNLIKEKWEDVTNILKKLSGVKEINVRMVPSFEGKISLLFSSVGKEWQCWKLEEMLLQKNLTQFLKNSIELKKEIPNEY